MACKWKLIHKENLTSILRNPKEVFAMGSGNLIVCFQTALEGNIKTRLCNRVESVNFNNL